MENHLWMGHFLVCQCCHVVYTRWYATISARNDHGMGILMIWRKWVDGVCGGDEHACFYQLFWHEPWTPWLVKVFFDLYIHLLSGPCWLGNRLCHQLPALSAEMMRKKKEETLEAIQKASEQDLRRQMMSDARWCPLVISWFIIPLTVDISTISPTY